MLLPYLSCSFMKVTYTEVFYSKSNITQLVSSKTYLTPVSISKKILHLFKTNYEIDVLNFTSKNVALKI